MSLMRRYITIKLHLLVIEREKKGKKTEKRKKKQNIKSFHCLQSLTMTLVVKQNFI